MLSARLFHLINQAACWMLCWCVTLEPSFNLCDFNYRLIFAGQIPCASITLDKLSALLSVKGNLSCSQTKYWTYIYIFFTSGYFQRLLLAYLFQCFFSDFNIGFLCCRVGVLQHMSHTLNDLDSQTQRCKQDLWDSGHLEALAVKNYCYRNFSSFIMHINNFYF